MAARVSAGAGSQYPEQFVDHKGQPTKKKVYTQPGNPNSPFYYVDVPPIPSATIPTAPTPVAGSGAPQLPQLPQLTGSGGALRPQAPRQQPTVQTPTREPNVAPIDVNAILNMWRANQNPMLPREAEIPRIDDTEAVRAGYNRAKDTAGQQGRAAMDALMDIQGARGVVGSGLGLNEAGGVIGAVNQNLSDVNREQLIQAYETELRRQEANQAARVAQRGQDVDTQTANNQILNAIAGLFGENFQGAINQRGQNINQGLGIYQGGIQQRGQNIDAENSEANRQVTMRGQDNDILQALMRIDPARFRTQY